MSEIEKILSIANKEIGYLEKSKQAYNNNPEIIYEKKEGAGQDNCTKYAKEMDDLNIYNSKKNFYPWCKIFIDWCFYQALGLERTTELLIGWSAGCTQAWNWFKNAGQIVSSPKKGDLIFFGDCDHIGIVSNVANGSVYTIEGNTSNKAELIVNGGTVTNKVYSLNSKYIKGYARPKYEENEEPIIPSDDEPISDKIAEDGLWGKDTTRKAQEIFGTPVDGIVSNQYAAYSNSNKGLLASTFDWKNNPSKNGSILIKAIQKRIGTREDGFIGPETIRAMQTWLETPIDGIVSYPSVMVKAFQKWLNEQ